jgi:hypothetical protein
MTPTESGPLVDPPVLDTVIETGPDACCPELPVALTKP